MFKLIKSYRDHSDELCYVVETNGRQLVINSRLMLKLRNEGKI